MNRMLRTAYGFLQKECASGQIFAFQLGFQLGTDAGETQRLKVVMVLGAGADFGILIQIEGFYTAKIGISARLELSGAEEARCGADRGIS